MTIEITPLAHGCELTLTTQTADAWADDTRRGWAMILDVLDETLPADAPSCGAGLAQHAAVPRRVAIYLAQLAETLELHRAMLVLDDTSAKNEDAVYGDLAASYRDIAAKLRGAADRMSAQHDLPMGAHDERKWTDEHMKAFARFVHEQGALASNPARGGDARRAPARLDAEAVRVTRDIARFFASVGMVNPDRPDLSLTRTASPPSAGRRSRGGRPEGRPEVRRRRRSRKRPHRSAAP